MKLDDLKDYAKEDAAKFAERARYVREEGVDIALDKWDSIKRTDPRILAAAGGGVVLLILILVLLFSGSKELPVLAKREIGGVLGYNYLLLENTSDEPLTNVVIILDDHYIYTMEEISPYQELVIKNKDFRYKIGEMGVGDEVEQDFVPSDMIIYADQGEKRVDLIGREKSFFEKLFGS